MRRENDVGDKKRFGFINSTTDKWNYNIIAERDWLSPARFEH